jgi:hypothetical protein
MSALTALIPPAWAQCNDCPQHRTISVSGTGVVTADADLAIVRVGYKLYGPDGKTAYASALETSNSIMSALTASGVPKSAIESTSQVLQHTQQYDLQSYPFNGPERIRREFTVTQSWVISVKPDDAARTLNTAITAGANESGWIQWIVQNPAALEAEASSKAVENTRQIAEQIAAKSNVHLGQLVSVQQNQQNTPIVGITDGISMNGVFGMGGPMQIGNQQLAINSRRVEFRVQIYAVYSIE